MTSGVGFDVLLSKRKTKMYILRITTGRDDVVWSSVSCVIHRHGRKNISEVTFRRYDFFLFPEFEKEDKSVDKATLQKILDSNSIQNRKKMTIIRKQLLTVKTTWLSCSYYTIINVKSIYDRKITFISLLLLYSFFTFIT